MSRLQEPASDQDQLTVLENKVIGCHLCSRLVAHREAIALKKRRAYQDWIYWGRPVPSFGDPGARVLIIGLAPGAHGSNRTGRMFTGDGSGNFLYRVLYQTGFASHPGSTSREDGLALRDIYITAAVRCCPPDNKPLPEEFARCRPFLEQTLKLLPNVRVVVSLGKLAHDVYLAILQSQGAIARRSPYPFRHGAAYALGSGMPLLMPSYHPSQQNTQTGRLTEGMLRKIFENARKVVQGTA
jgi:uracil-DNA glycosylase family 4